MSRDSEPYFLHGALYPSVAYFRPTPRSFFLYQNDTYRKTTKHLSFQVLFKTPNLHSPWTKKTF